MQKRRSVFTWILTFIGALIASIAPAFALSATSTTFTTALSSGPTNCVLRVTFVATGVTPDTATNDIGAILYEDATGNLVFGSAAPQVLFFIVGLPNDTINFPHTVPLTALSAAQFPITVKLVETNVINPVGVAGTPALSSDTITASDLLNAGGGCTTIAAAANTAPVATATISNTTSTSTTAIGLNAGDNVTLDASGSSDVDGQSLTFSWTQTAGPAVTLVSPNSATASFVAPSLASAATVAFRVDVSDGLTTTSHTVTGNLAAAPGGNVNVLLQIAGAATNLNWPISSNMAAAPGFIPVSGGAGSLSLAMVTAGSYSLSFHDLSGAGYAILSMACSNANGSGSVSARLLSITVVNGQSITCTVVASFSGEDEQSAARQMVAARMTHMLANQPQVQRQIDRLNGRTGSGGASVFGLAVPSSSALPFKFNHGERSSLFESSYALAALRQGSETRQDDIWIRLSGTQFDTNGATGRVGLGQIGFDRVFGENLLLGVYGQFDTTDWNKGVAKASGQGWLFGSYGTLRLDENLFASLSGGWGRSFNKVDAAGTGSATSFDTDRFLAHGALTGQFALSQVAIVSPTLSAGYMQEALSPLIGANDFSTPTATRVALGEVSFSPRYTHYFTTGSGLNYSLSFNAETVYGFGEGAQQSGTTGLRGRVTASVNFQMVNGSAFQASLSHDGIGQGDNSSTSGSLLLTLRF